MKLLAAYQKTYKENKEKFKQITQSEHFSKALNSDFKKQKEEKQEKNNKYSMRGRGAFGKVYNATVDKIGFSYRSTVVKEQKNISEDDLARLDKELKIQQKLQDEGIAPKVIDQHLKKTANNNYTHKIYQEDSGVNLKKFMVSEVDEKLTQNSHKKNQQITASETTEQNQIYSNNDDIKHIFLNLAKKFSLMHKLNIIHRDIKPSNIFLKGSGEVKIGDFGLSTKIRPGSHLSDSSGSTYYMAPELLEKNSFDPYKADVWAFGITCASKILKIEAYKMGIIKKEGDNFSFNKQGYDSLISSINDNETLSDDAKHFLVSMLAYEPTSRISFMDLQYHPYLNKLPNLNDDKQIEEYNSLLDQFGVQIKEFYNDKKNSNRYPQKTLKKNLIITLKKQIDDKYEAMEQKTTMELNKKQNELLQKLGELTKKYEDATINNSQKTQMFNKNIQKLKEDIIKYDDQFHAIKRELSIRNISNQIQVYNKREFAAQAKLNKTKSFGFFSFFKKIKIKRQLSMLGKHKAFLISQLEELKKKPSVPK